MYSYVTESLFIIVDLVVYKTRINDWKIEKLALSFKDEVSRELVNI